MTETLGQRITRLRGERGMSQGDLADALDISRQSVSKWETDTSTPELEKLIRLAELFDISMDMLILGKEPPKPDTPPEPSPEPPAQDPSIKRGCKRQPISQTQKFVGLGLIGISILFVLMMLVLYGTWDALVSSILLSSPLWCCGILCLCVRRRIGLWCTWMIYILVSGYLYFATGTTRGAIWNLQFRTYGDTFRKITAVTETLLLLVLYLWSFFSFRNIRCPIRLRMKPLTVACIGFVVGYFLFFVLFEMWIPRAILSYVALDHPSVLFSYYHIRTFVVSVIDQFWILGLLLCARMLYNEHKAAKAAAKTE